MCPKLGSLRDIDFQNLSDHELDFHFINRHTQAHTRRGISRLIPLDPQPPARDNHATGVRNKNRSTVQKTCTKLKHRLQNVQGTLAVITAGVLWTETHWPVGVASCFILFFLFCNHTFSAACLSAWSLLFACFTEGDSWEHIWGGLGRIQGRCQFWRQCSSCGTPAENIQSYQASNNITLDRSDILFQWSEPDIYRPLTLTWRNSSSHYTTLEIVTFRCTYSATFKLALPRFRSALLTSNNIKYVHKTLPRSLVFQRRYTSSSTQSTKLMTTITHWFRFTAFNTKKGNSGKRTFEKYLPQGISNTSE